MEVILQTQNLVRRFGGLVAVNGVNFSLQRGEIRGLIGPNGSGKTTFINLITGVYEPSEGDIFFRNEKITGLAPNLIANRGLLRTFQVPRLFGSMTLLENMLLPHFAEFSFDYRDHYVEVVARADALLESAGLMHLRNQWAKTLSGGQKALLQVLRGFMLDDLSLFLLDEPFAGVNIIVKETIMDMIYSKAAEGITFLVVSHEMASIRRLCPLVTVLAEGKIIAEGDMDSIASDETVISAYLGG